MTIVLKVIFVILCVLLAVCVFALVCNEIELRRLERSIRSKRRLDTTMPIVTIYTLEDGTKVTIPCNGPPEVEPPADNKEAENG